MATLAELAAAKNNGQAPRQTNRPIPPTRAAQKIMNTNAKFGSKGIGAQQATTRTIYDSILLTATAADSKIVFFEDAKTRTFPLTNLQENKLQRGESLAVERIGLSVLKTTTGVPKDVISISPLSAFTEFTGLHKSDIDIKFDTSTVISKMSMQTAYSPFNKDAHFGTYFGSAEQVIGQDIKQMDTDLVIPELLTFTAELHIPKITALPAGFDFYICLMFEGFGTIFSPKSSF